MIVANPFDRSDLFIAREHHEVITVATDGSDTSRAFRRQVDAWWLALCFGVRNDEHRPLPTDRRKFMDGTIWSSDPWRITHLQLLGLHWHGKDALKHPAKIITTANEYANAGFDWVTDIIRNQPNSTLPVNIHLTDVLSAVS